MASIPSVTNSVAQWDNYATPQSASRTNSVDSPSRESDLARQLEDRLSTRLNRIRSSIAPAEMSAPAGTGGKQILDINA